MPNYRSINMVLKSQFDVETIPEYYPPHGNKNNSGGADVTPQFVDDATSTCSVFVPFLPGSTFWIRYAVSPPVPDSHLFLFKLYINGTHITNWATCKQEGWKGKMMFGLYESHADEQGRKRVEKRVLCFSSTHEVDFDENTCVEIKVHRARGRTRIERELQQYSDTEQAKTSNGVNLVDAGRAGASQPKRFYKFALIDPVDQPFATFRYFYRTWKQLRDLGVLDQDCYGSGEENDLPVIEPLEGEMLDEQSSIEDQASPRGRLMAQQHPSRAHASSGRHLSSTSPSGKPTTPELDTKPLPPSPSYRRYAADSYDGCAVRSPSPPSPPSPRQTGSATKHWGRNRSVSSLMKTMSFTWKRQK